MADVKISDLPTTGSAARTDYVETSDGSNSRRRTLAQVVGLTQQSDVSGLTTALSGKANSSHTHPQSDITNLATDLSGKVATSRNVSTQHSLTGGGNLTEDRTLSLVNDTASPGNNKVYGTDGSGERGWKDDPAGGAVDSVNGATGEVVLDLEDVGASVFGAELAAVDDAAAARTKIGVTATSLSANQYAAVDSAGTSPEARADKIAVVFAFEVTEDGTYVLGLWPNIPVTLTEVSASTLSGTCSIKIQKGGVDINGFGSAVALTTSVTDTASTETLAEDAKLTLVISSASSLTGIYVTLKGVRTGN